MQRETSEILISPYISLHLPTSPYISPTSPYISPTSPRLDEFQPQLILLSSGFDAHRSDLAEAARLQAGDYFQLTEMLVSLAWKIESCHG